MSFSTVYMLTAQLFVEDHHEHPFLVCCDESSGTSHDAFYDFMNGKATCVCYAFLHEYCAVARKIFNVYVKLI